MDRSKRRGRASCVALVVLAAWGCAAPNAAAPIAPAPPPAPPAEPKVDAAPSRLPPVAKDAKGHVVAAARPSGRLATSPGALAPLPASAKAPYTHAPFASGQCKVCHASNDPAAPGPVENASSALCTSCHEEVEELMKARSHKHGGAAENCLNCHNPHNAREARLLLAPTRNLCLSCHEAQAREVAEATVVHQALDDERGCLNCHNPHASNVEKQLVGLTYDLCMKCHSVDDKVDAQGRKLTNMKKLLAENAEWHSPVAAKECSACHSPHAGKNFRLLREAYPSAFYAPWAPETYALCFNCHSEKLASERETTSQTQFRDGARNLHFLHVNKAVNGRSCRACHEVHASKQPHHIRDTVPFGPKGWQLRVQFTRTPLGGSCERTCHSLKTYANRTTPRPEPVAPPRPDAKPAKGDGKGKGDKKSKGNK